MFGNNCSRDRFSVRDAVERHGSRLMAVTPSNEEKYTRWLTLAHIHHYHSLSLSRTKNRLQHRAASHAARRRPSGAKDASIK